MYQRKRAAKAVRYRIKSSTFAIVILAILITAGCKEQKLPSLAESLDKSPIPVQVQVIETQPLDDARDIELDTPIQVSFNAVIDSATVNENTFIIREDTAVVAGTFSISDSIITFIPSQEYDRSKVITSTLSPNIADTQGNNMEQEYAWNFTTRPLSKEERTPPSVTATKPRNGATDVDLNKNILVQFSKKLNPETINSNTFYVQNDNGSIVTGSVSYTETTAKFNPSGALQDGTEFTATITVDIEDQFGHSPDQKYSWTFTTKVIDRTPPRVTSTKPLNNAYNVDDDVQITATFSEPMDPSTINNETFLLYENHSTGFQQVAGSVYYANNIARFTPNVDLRDREYYIAVISASVTDLAGNELGERYRWNFVTEDN